MRPLRENILFLLLSLVLAVAVVTCCHYVVSPLYHEPMSTDSSIFWIVGSNWMQGALPYVDLWDLKGPVIFLVNGVAWLLTRSPLGLYLLSILFWWGSIYMSYRLLRLEYTSPWAFFFTVISCLAINGQYLNRNVAGNNVAELLLPWLMLSFTFVFKWLGNVEDRNQWRHRPSWAFVYGLCFGLSLMTRLTNTIGLCAAVLVIIVCLIARGEWKNLGHNALAYIAGVLIIVLPFVVYFHLQGALDEMWYGTLLYNFEYSAWNVMSFTKRFWTLFLSRNITSLVLMLVALLMFVCDSRRRLSAVMWLTVSVVSSLYFMFSNLFCHYFLITYPYVCIIFMECHRMWRDRSEREVTFIRKGGLGDRFVGVLIGVVVLQFSIYSVAFFSHKTMQIRSYFIKNIHLPKYREMVSGLPSDYKESFVGYNIDADFYQYEDIVPDNPFFTLQDAEIMRGPSLEERIHDAFSRRDTKYILVSDSLPTAIEDILRSHYTLLRTDSMSEYNRPLRFRLYQRK